MFKKTINNIQDKSEKEKIGIMWVLVIFCMLIVIGLWKINLSWHKPAQINSGKSDNLNLPSFPELPENINKGISDLEKIDELKNEILNEDRELNKELPEEIEKQIEEENK